MWMYIVEFYFFYENVSFPIVTVECNNIRHFISAKNFANGEMNLNSIRKAY